MLKRIIALMLIATPLMAGDYWVHPSGYFPHTDGVFSRNAAGNGKAYLPVIRTVSEYTGRQNKNSQQAHYRTASFHFCSNIPNCVFPATGAGLVALLFVRCVVIRLLSILFSASQRGD